MRPNLVLIKYNTISLKESIANDKGKSNAFLSHGCICNILLAYAYPPLPKDFLV
jgi:hypothetical protein